MSRAYLQFPLCALAWEGSDFDRLNNIISFACVEAGRRRWPKFREAERQAWRFRTPDPSVCACPIDLKSDEQLKVVAGAEFLQIQITNVAGILARHAQLDQFVKDFERQHGKDARVRIIAAWVFEARDNRGISPNDLAVLAAIYSKIGCKKGAVRITREEIWRRAHGFKSKAVFVATFPRKRCINSISRPFKCRIRERQVRSAIDRLFARKFFSRATYARRQTYYSHRLNMEQLSDSVLKQKTRRYTAAKERKEANAALTERVRAALNELGATRTSMRRQSPPLK